MRNSIILEVTNDNFEYVVNIFDSTQKLAEHLQVDKYTAQHILDAPRKNAQTKFIRVRLSGRVKKE